MLLNGNLKFLGAGEAQNLRIENLASDPSTPAIGQMWYNTTTSKLKYFDGLVSYDIATGGNAALLQQEIDALELSVGLNEDGSLPSLTGSNYFGGATSLIGALLLADTQLKANADAIVAEAAAARLAEAGLQTELNATQVGAGLNVDGTLATFTGSNYVVAAASLRDASVLLDAQTKTNADAIAAEATAARAAEGTLTTNLATEASTARAAEGTLTTNLATEVTRATDAEAVLTTAITNEATRAGNAELAITQAMDAKLAGLTWKTSVVALSVVNVSLTGLQTVDGIDLVAGNRVLLNGQTASAENGIYVVSADAWIRSTDMDSTTPINEVNSAAVFVESGTVHGDSGWTEINTVDTLETDPIQFTQFTGAASFVSGSGLLRTGNTIDVGAGDGIIVDADAVRVALQSVGALQFVSGTIGVKGDGSSITIGAAGIKVSDALTTEVTALRTDLTAESLAARTAEAAEIVARDAAIEVANDRAVAAEVSLQAELDATQTGAGLNIDGTLAAFTAANFISASTSLRAAAVALDTQGKSTADAVSTEVTRATDAETALGAKLAGCFFVYTGTPAATVHTVVHGIGSKFCNLTVVDSTDEVIIPQSIKYDSVNQLTVTFNSPITCTVVVSGLKA